MIDITYLLDCKGSVKVATDELFHQKKRTNRLNSKYENKKFTQKHS